MLYIDLNIDEINLYKIAVHELRGPRVRENKLITLISSKNFAFKEKLKMYIEEVSDNDFSSFSKLDLITRENNVFSNETDIETLKLDFFFLLGIMILHNFVDLLKIHRQ